MYQGLRDKLAERTRSIIIYAIETYKKQEIILQELASNRQINEQRFLLSLSDNLAEFKDRDRKSEELYLGYKPSQTASATDAQSSIDLSNTDDVAEVTIYI